MSHTYVCNRIHVVFSTKERRKLIPPDLQPRLWKYFAGIGENKHIRVFSAGGIEDHVHLLISLPATITLADAVSALKANASRWIREHGIDFAWQEGYSAFSVSASNLDAVIRYIESQAEHHRKHSFAAEIQALLEKHGFKMETATST